MIYIKYLRIVGHLFLGIYVVIIQLRTSNPERRDFYIRRWSIQLLNILGVQLKIQGQLSTQETGILFVSNHISWLDIHVINAWHPMRFVAKKEVASWPIFGYFAKKLNTLFIDRQVKGDSKNISDQMTHALSSGHHLCIFPEGTSSEGYEVLPFKANLFQAAINAKTPCQPIAITYTSLLDGKMTLGPAFIGDMGLLESIKNTVKAAPLVVTIGIPEICLERLDRKLLATEAWQRIHDARAIKN